MPLALVWHLAYGKWVSVGISQKHVVSSVIVDASVQPVKLSSVQKLSAFDPQKLQDQVGPFLAFFERCFLLDGRTCRALNVTRGVCLAGLASQCLSCKANLGI